MSWFFSKKETKPQPTPIAKVEKNLVKVFKLPPDFFQRVVEMETLLDVRG